jgi:hypothetical protein
MQPRRRLNSVESRLAAQLSAQIRKALGNAIIPSGRVDQAALCIERAEQPIAPAQLAAVHPGGEAARTQIRAVYEACLAHYREHVRPQDHALDDVGAAFATFIAACIDALRGTRTSPASKLQMERQLNALLQSDPVWTRASATERQSIFERFAILAVFVEGCSARAPLEGSKAVAHVRQAARDYLRESFGIDPDVLVVGSDGLRVELG